MGAWGYGSFENDDALDWVYGLQKSKGLSLIIQAFDAIISSIGDYLDASDCANALAAAETVAALAGHPATALPEEVIHWVEEQERGLSQTRQLVDEQLINKAKRAVHAVLSDSELKELWEETDGFEDWEAVVADLLERLG
jgi:hypothetical protein